MNNVKNFTEDSPARIMCVHFVQSAVRYIAVSDKLLVTWSLSSKREKCGVNKLARVCHGTTVLFEGVTNVFPGRRIEI